MQNELKFLKTIIKENDSIVFACSGGPDSMCLLHLLLTIKEERNITLICAHVNHKKRKESDEEYIFVQNYCKENDILFEGFEINNYHEKNFHNEAHQIRRKFFNEIIKKYHAKYFMTAHHGDDLMETILMRITRGSSIKGYNGFQKIQEESNYTIIRPLITKTKQDILTFNKENKIPFRIDLSNEQDTYTRNRFRHHILPFLKEENKDVHLKFLKFSEEFSRINEFLVKFTKNALTECIENDNVLIVELKKFDKILQKEIIKEYVKNIYQEEITLMTEKHINAILNLINSKKSNNKISLPKNYWAKKNYDLFKIEKNNKEPNYLIQLKEEVKTQNWRIKKISDTNEKSNNIIRLNSKEINGPLFIRNRKEKDKIASKNLKGHQKIKDIFMNAKIPLNKRNEWPILVDKEDQILWVPGLKKSKFDKDFQECYDIIYKYDLSKEKEYATKK